jgi:hypothetical protein
LALTTSNQTSRSDAHSLQAIDIEWWAHQGSNLGPAERPIRLLSKSRRPPAPSIKSRIDLFVRHELPTLTALLVDMRDTEHFSRCPHAGAVVLAAPCADIVLGFGDSALN